MGATAADGAFAAGDDFRFKQHGVNIWKVLQLQPRNFLSNEMLNRLQGGQFFAVHQGESVTDVLGATSSSNAMDVIFRMLRDIVIDNVTDAGDVESSRGDIGCDHHFVFAALESFERFDPLTLGAIRMQDGDRMVSLFQFVRDRDRRRVWFGEKISALSKLVRSSSAMSRSNFCSAATG